MNIKRDLKPRRQRWQPIRSYTIRCAGHLEDAGLDWWGDISIANLPNGESVLSGSIPDQAALMRVLLHLNDLGVTILSVKAQKRRR